MKKKHLHTTLYSKVYQNGSIIFKADSLTTEIQVNPVAGTLKDTNLPVLVQRKGRME